jgi:hypothetical protein
MPVVTSQKKVLFRLCVNPTGKHVSFISPVYSSHILWSRYWTLRNKWGPDNAVNPVLKILVNFFSPYMPTTASSFEIMTFSGEQTNYRNYSYDFKSCLSVSALTKKKLKTALLDTKIAGCYVTD